MIGPVEVDPIALLVSFAVALLVPTTAVYLLVAHHTERRLDEVTVIDEAQLEVLSEGLDRPEDDQRRTREALAERLNRLAVASPRHVERAKAGPPDRPASRGDGVPPGR